MPLAHGSDDFFFRETLRSPAGTWLPQTQNATNTPAVPSRMLLDPSAFSRARFEFFKIATPFGTYNTNTNVGCVNLIKIDAKYRGTVAGSRFGCRRGVIMGQSQVVLCQHCRGVGVKAPLSSGG